MKQHASIKPAIYFATHTTEVLHALAEGHSPYIITENGKETAIIQHIDAYKKIQKTLALLKILALGEKDIAEGRTTSDSDVFLDAEAMLNASKA